MNDAQMADVFKALADSHRRRLLDALMHDPGQTLGRLCESAEISRQGTSKHLKILEQAHLVVVHWQGREKLHYLNPLPIQQISERWIRKYETARVAALANLTRKLTHE